MAVRKARAYSKIHMRAFTRKSSVKAKNYIKTVPPQKVVRFKMGAIRDYNEGKFKSIMMLSNGDHQTVYVRDLAIEAARQYVNKILDTDLPGQTYFEVKAYPHQILRENKMLTGAGADRMSTGMQLSFGATTNRAAVVKAQHPLFLVGYNGEKARKIIYDALSRVKAKLPFHGRVVMANWPVK